MKKILLALLALVMMTSLACNNESKDTVNLDLLDHTSNDLDFDPDSLDDQDQVSGNEDQESEDQAQDDNQEPDQEEPDPEPVLVDLTSDEVWWVQEALKVAGFYTKLDGQLTEDLNKRIEDFQSANGLEPGLYNQRTKKLLEAYVKEAGVPGLGTDLLLINKNYHLSSSYKPENIRVVTSPSTKDVYLPDRIASQVERMIKAASRDGVSIVLVSGYRSYDYQERIFSNRVASHGFEEAQTIIAIPGQSEHQTGLALDVSTQSIGYVLDSHFDQTPEYDWLMAHCYEYGFILRYLEGRQDDTGYVYEPWHYRYIGDVEVARYIMENNMTLEDYLEEQN